MRALVIGSGGREHAIAWKLAQSPSITQVIVTPGNPGCARIGRCVAPPSATPQGYLTVASELGVDFTVVGPEAPLVAGTVDLFEAAGRPVFGPTQAAAELEGSKLFTKRFLERHSIPTAAYRSVESTAEAEKHLDAFTYPLVLKADGLAAGKGVVIVQDKKEALSVLGSMFSGELVGAAGSRVVIEEFLSGEEISFIALSDGENILPLEASQDHKRLGDDDAGPNTGGMGAYSDSRLLKDAERQFVIDRILRPTIDGMRAEGRTFKGFLYAGLMMTASGPQVLEFNVRLGDPETQCLLHRMTGDFGALLHQAARGRLDASLLQSRPDPSIVIVLAAHGYPGKVRSGDAITGIEAAEAAGAVVFHAGTRMGAAGLETSGGRVLGVTASGPVLAGAIANAYRAAAHIHFDGMQLRRDIGRKGLTRYN